MTNYKPYKIYFKNNEWSVHYEGKCIPFQYDPNTMADDLVEGIVEDLVFSNHQNVLDGQNSVYKNTNFCTHK